MSKLNPKKKKRIARGKEIGAAIMVKAYKI